MGLNAGSTAASWSSFLTAMKCRPLCLAIANRETYSRAKPVDISGGHDHDRTAIDRVGDGDGFQVPVLDQRGHDLGCRGELFLDLETGEPAMVGPANEAPDLLDVDEQGM